MKNIRCLSVAVQIRVTEHDEHNRPIGEVDLPVCRVFRANNPDLWKAIDAHVKQTLAGAAKVGDNKPAQPKKQRKK